MSTPTQVQTQSMPDKNSMVPLGTKSTNTNTLSLNDDRKQVSSGHQQPPPDTYHAYSGPSIPPFSYRLFTYACIVSGLVVWFTSIWIRQLLEYSTMDDLARGTFRKIGWEYMVDLSLWMVPTILWFIFLEVYLNSGNIFNAVARVLGPLLKKFCIKPPTFSVPMTEWRTGLSRALHWCAEKVEPAPSLPNREDMEDVNADEEVSMLNRCPDHC